MATEPILITITAATGTADEHRSRISRCLADASDYWALTKPEVNFLIVICSAVGFYLGSRTNSEDFPWLRLIHTLLGTLLVASGASTLKQYIERLYDAGLLAVLTLLTYLFAYTPLKRKTSMCTLVGAFPGAMPPLIGWAAATGRLSLQAVELFGFLFLWQFPHFMAIVWMYREDYARAGYLVLPTRSRNRFLAWVTALPTLAGVYCELREQACKQIFVRELEASRRITHVGYYEAMAARPRVLTKACWARVCCEST